jgi:hypothetical protein
MAIYGCGSECKVGDIVQCIEAPRHSIHPGVPYKYYRVGVIKDLGRGGHQYADIRLEGEEYAPDGGTDSNSRRFILIRRKSGLLDTIPPQPAKFKAGDMVVRVGKTERLFIHKITSFEQSGVRYIHTKTQWGGFLCGLTEDQFEPAPPITPKFKVGDVVRVLGGRPEWKVSAIRNDGNLFTCEYECTYLPMPYLPMPNGTNTFIEMSLSPCGEISNLYDYCASQGISDAVARNLYHFVETKMQQPLREKLAQIKEIAQ